MTSPAASAQPRRAAPAAANRPRGVRLAAIFAAIFLLQAAVVLVGLVLLRG
jgi:hypothetical protein